MFCDTSRSHMSTPKRCVCTLLLAFLVIPWAPLAWASAYDGRPRLVIILVVDQFRADYLDRYRADLKGRGFRLFLDKGAYFEDCHYDSANTKTAPGHATLGIGAYTDSHGISANAWWDLTRNKTRPLGQPRKRLFFVSGGAKTFCLKATMIKPRRPVMIETGAKAIPSHEL
jgi:Type I phosphodiesterase / nucleotide pyrophosphatase